MRFSLFAVLLSYAALSCAVSNYCLAPDPPESLVAAHKILGEQEKSAASRLMRRDPTRLDIDFYIHVIESHEEKGKIKDNVIQEQIQLIESIYSRYNIFFHYKGIDYTVNDDWGVSINNTSSRGKALRKGDYLTLNIYITTAIDDKYLGICTFPRNSDYIPGVDSVMGGDEESDDGSDYLLEDGCTIGGYTLPGGHFSGEDMKGLTAIHEIGHWLGLFHTFQGDNCAGPGDMIQDTRVQANQSRGCPVGRISCPDAKYQATPEDPIHNYMDYSDDDCTTQFTTLQMVRVFGVWPIFRVANGLNASTTGSYSPSTLANSTSTTLANTTSTTPANSTSATTGNYSIPSMNSAKTTFLPSMSGALPQPTGMAGPPRSESDRSEGSLPASWLGNPSEPFATSGPAGSVDSDSTGDSDGSVGSPLAGGPGGSIGSISVGGPGRIMGSFPEGGQGASVGSISEGGSSGSVGSPSEGGQNEFGQGNPIPNLGSVTIQCPDGNLFATGAAGSCVLNVVTMTTLSCS